MKSMSILILGAGGREHALAWKLLQSPCIEKVYVAPGNPGMKLTAGIEVLTFANLEASADFAARENIALTIVGPELLLADGVVDLFQTRNLPIYGPSRAAAQLEISKEFAKLRMQAAGVPTATHEAFTDVTQATDYAREMMLEQGKPCVVKADGPMAGKGVFICADFSDAGHAIRIAFAAGAKKVLIEEKLEGPEVSAFYICDGLNFKCLAKACDYKRLYDGHLGPNTGGMGAYAPASWLAPEIHAEIESRVVRPILGEMVRGGTPFVGTLFVGLMITKDGPKVLEFNTRFGDPETQAIMPLLDEDLFPWLLAAAKGELASMPLDGDMKLHDGASLHVVMTAKGYALENTQLQTGDAISVGADISDSQAVLFWSGVGQGSGSELTTKGGRVLGLSATGISLTAARVSAYDAIAHVNFADAHWRTDIGIVE